MKQEERNTQLLADALLLAAFVEVTLRTVNKVPNELITDKEGNQVSNNLIKSLTFSNLRDNVVGGN